MGKLYGIGVGPGDPELLTIKGKRIINEVDFLFCPEKKEGAGSFAFEIIDEHLENDNVKIVNLVYPMHYKEDDLEKMWRHNAGIIGDMLQGDKRGAFITLGDPTVYSTFMYTLPHVDKTSIEVEIVPGITSFCAVASELKLPLVEWEENLTIMPVRKKDNAELQRSIAHSDNLVLMKPCNQPNEIVQMLKNNGLEKNFMLISKVGTGEEVLIDDIEQLENTKLPYLSTMIIKKGGL
ncbi:precorrin-2/cobalt-factor-2 C20-methyltransferase [Peptoclostridium litorale DSM 5388]|uniref:Cobalt-precorrin-2 C(20)-methyltransferase CbiL n=1 Tax=Peptoclostridium litorale DSM 5388 TaxID=1121324 RepID=A0A069RI86_PEPLI|nr:precorrin-2 C(20)-methyltransferase [Peptoclostridium litorale]KDR96503.1 cobalt-precorrin-2 C(20)-methyltransferase CbiL [Peptoclostridium litorale DSM 5388]SIN69833.1 precorrin-2/cobalt-factor-2 C20-methyltransferase [Peptoclostridium litorale DSM 5388]